MRCRVAQRGFVFGRDPARLAYDFWVYELPRAEALVAFAVDEKFFAALKSAEVPVFGVKDHDFDLALPAEAVRRDDEHRAAPVLEEALDLRRALARARRIPHAQIVEAFGQK